ncbi:DUF5719 family protein [Microbacterium sp. SD291]|uniref:DUF5719 family protein n=1 Tax=Microbacterium sp. SD291 TaxID=2782007 RepID=UPI001A9638A6|nr:DUF5719 family protein [Microbacterium sp. SD291]MBO0979406.1 hypothetical protein [Microbacterium sp. SD291]
MSGNRAVRVAATSARVLTGAVVAAACAVGVVLAITAPWPTVTHDPAQVEVTPLPGDTVLVCNGDFRAIGRDPSEPLQMVSAASPRFTVEGSAGEPEIAALSTGDLVDAGEVRRLTGVVDGRTAPLLAATESVTLSEDDLSGFAAAPCREARIESWLVGGSVETGSEDLIVLTNPGAVPSSVTLTVYGSVPGSRTVIVPAGAQVALPLTSIATGAEVPVVNVTATGSPVRAVLQSSLTRTLDPVGIDLQDAVAAPQRHPVIPGVEIFESDADDSSGAVIRLLSPPTDTKAVVTVRALGETSIAREFTVDLTAGTPTEMSLAEMPAGSYSVQVEADDPVLAAVRQQDGGGPESDFAWAMPAPEFRGAALVAVPAGPASRLLLVNDEETDSVVSVAAVDGEAEEITVPAGSSIAVDVEARTTYSIETSDPIRAAVSQYAPGAMAVWPVWPAAGPEKSITVYP